MVECRTPEREVRGSRPTAAVLCPWARHFTPRKYWLITQEAMAPSRYDWKIVDWDVKPQHNQPTNCQGSIEPVGSFNQNFEKTKLIFSGSATIKKSKLALASGRSVNHETNHRMWTHKRMTSPVTSSLAQGCKNAGKYAYFPCHWYLPAFMANMVANMAYMVNSMDSYQI